jgi:hypothetical protein
MKAVVGLSELEEDQRIAMIGHHACCLGQVVGFMVEADGSKGDRYLAKLRKAYPTIALHKRALWSPGVELIKVGPPGSAPN